MAYINIICPDCGTEENTHVFHLEYDNEDIWGRDWVCLACGKYLEQAEVEICVPVYKEKYIYYEIDLSEED